MKKWISGLLALSLLAALCAGCGGSPDPVEPPSGLYYDITGVDPRETVLEVDGNKIPAELYFYWLAYTCSNMEYNLKMYNSYYGLYGEVFGEDGAVIWDADFEEGKTLAQQARENAENTVKFYAAIENLAAEQGVTLTEEDRTALEASLTSAEEQLGGAQAFEENLSRMGISRESFVRISEAGYLFDDLVPLVLEEGGPLHRDLGGSVYVDHILLATVDTATNEPLSDEEAAAKRATAEDLLAQLQAASDKEALFGRLVEEYGEDPGRAAEAGYLMDENTSFVQEFKDAALALEVGEVSGIVESSYGYHILLRKELTEEQRTTLAGDQLSAILDERMAAAEVVRSEALDAVEVGSFYTSYIAKLEELTAANEDQSAVGGDQSAAGGEQNPGGEDQTGSDGASEPSGEPEG